MAASMEASMFIMFNMHVCMCIHSCMHAHVCLHRVPPYTHAPISPIPKGGDPPNQLKCYNN